MPHRRPAASAASEDPAQRNSRRAPRWRGEPLELRARTERSRGARILTTQRSGPPGSVLPNGAPRAAWRLAGLSISTNCSCASCIRSAVSRVLRERLGLILVDWSTRVCSTTAPECPLPRHGRGRGRAGLSILCVTCTAHGLMLRRALSVGMWRTSSRRLSLAEIRRVRRAPPHRRFLALGRVLVEGLWRRSPHSSRRAVALSVGVRSTSVATSADGRRVALPADGVLDGHGGGIASGSRSCARRRKKENKRKDVSLASRGIAPQGRLSAAWVLPVAGHHGLANRNPRTSGRCAAHENWRGRRSRSFQRLASLRTSWRPSARWLLHSLSPLLRLTVYSPQSRLSTFHFARS